MIKNQELATQLFEMMNTAVDAAEQMKEYLQQKNIAAFDQLAEDLFQLIETIKGVSENLDAGDVKLNLPQASESVRVSIMRIYEYAEMAPDRAARKVEFELIPLIEEMRIHFYFWGIVYPDPEKMKKYYAEDIHVLGDNKYQAEAERTGKYKYELSITVLAYNKLEYTKQCIKTLLGNLPKGISYELILLNHGSTDGTKEFFESIHPDKQLDIAVNGGGSGAVSRIFEGRYHLTISNDVLILENSIQNMYHCICSDRKIAWVVPATSNISNLQAPQVAFNAIEDVSAYAAKNNISNKYRWEQRVRLVNPLQIFRGTIYNELNWPYVFQGASSVAFPDDRLSLQLRRNGYKMCLAKDAFCYHYGSITLREGNSEQRYIEGRKKFEEAFGVDPWSTGFCYSGYLFSKLHCDKTESVKILGIDCGIGSNSLKIKEELKEKVHNEQVYLKNLTTKKNVLEDLKGISDEAEYISDYSKINEAEEYDYIISEDYEPVYESIVDYIEHLKKYCKPFGKIIIDISVQSAQVFGKAEGQARKLYPDAVIVEENYKRRCWIIITK